MPRTRKRMGPLQKHFDPSEGPPAIQSIEVDELFGIYNYRLQSERAEGAWSPVLILYGDNGAGKTTLLRLVYHLLSPEDNRGHRTFLAGVPFRRFSVKLSSGFMVQVERRDKALTGSFHIVVRAPRKKPIESFMAADVLNVVAIKPDGSAPALKWAAVLERIRSLGLALSYLPDDRKMQSAFDSPEEQITLFQGSETQQFMLQQRVARLQQVAEKTTLDLAIRRAEEWLRSEAIQATSTGEADTNKVYLDVVRRIFRSRSSRKTSATRTELVAKLHELKARSVAFAALGLMTVPNLDELADAILTSGAQKRRIIEEVLRPYVSGLEARLNASQNVQETMQGFLSGINAFLTNKIVDFSLTSGITIRAAGKGVLAPTMLSSGEKQLLLLFCNTIAARRGASIFIIDEPEISLNVKWQRKLLPALLELVRGTDVQFLVATHSIEILAKYRQHVFTLRGSHGA